MELDELHEGVNQSLPQNRDLEGTRQQAEVLSAHPPRETAEQQRRLAAMRIESVATAGHHAAGDLEGQFPQTARYIDEAATGFKHISDLLRDPNLDEVAALIGNLGRKQPAAIVATVVLAGLGLSWLLRSSNDAVARTTPDPGDGEGGVYGIH